MAMTHPRPALLHDWFWNQVAARPERSAVDVPPGPGRSERVSWTYGELAAAAEAVRATLGDGPGLPLVTGECVVAVLIPRGDPWLYAAEIGVMTAGAAYLAPDFGVPDDHLRFVLEDAGVVAVVGDAAGLARLDALVADGWDAPARVDVAALRPTEVTSAAVAIRARRAWLTPESLAYVIYTSGTTGRPKGVAIEHRSITRLIDDDLAYLQIGPGDRGAQNSSSAFDSSVEELWVPLAAGATVVVVDDLVSRSGPDLVGWLHRERVSLLMPTPTLLLMMHCADPERALPHLRTIYIGGEAVTPELVAQWAPGRRMINGYGPTECTVTVTRAELRAGAPVTIGQPVAGSVAHVLDPSLDAVATDVDGELCIGGESLARGYLGQPQWTAEKFVEHPEFGRIYRTGDAVRRDADGNLHYLGRIDSQVKLRGYRVELEAIEARMVEVLEDVGTAACCVHGAGTEAELIAFWTSRSGPDGLPEAVRDSQEHATRFRRALVGVLPSYMVPDRFVAVSALPTTVSGKLDRRALAATAGSLVGRSEVDPSPTAGETRAAQANVDSRDPTERALGAAFAAAVGRDAGLDADFFEVGGTSLRAAQLISRLRRDPATACLDVRDVYELRTARALAARARAGSPVAPGDSRVASGHGGCGGSATPRSQSDRDGRGSRDSERTDRERVGQAAEDPACGEPLSRPAGNARLVTAIQGLWISGVVAGGAVVSWWLLALGAPAAADWVAPWVLVLLGPAIFGLAGLLYVPVSVVLVALWKRLWIGRYRPTRAPCFGSFHVRHWLVVRATALVPWRMLEGTVFHAWALRALGARIGRRVHIHRGVDLYHGGWDLLTIGDDASIGRDAQLGLVELVDGAWIVAPVEIGDGATLDVRAGVGGGGTVGAGAELTALSWLANGDSLPAGERWHGVPARSVGVVASSAPASSPGESSPAPRDPRASMEPWRHGVGLIALRAVHEALVGLPFAMLAAALCARYGVVDGASLRALFDAFSRPGLLAALLGLVATALPLSLLMRGLLLRVLPTVPDGRHGRWSPMYWRIWLRTGHLEAAGDWLAGSLYWRWWLRLAGMRLGRNGEISTIIDVLPENVVIGEQTFFADGIYLAGPDVRRGVVTTAETTLGRATFLGNHAVIPAGARLPDDILLGVCTLADDQEIRSGTSWFGHPVFELPRREVIAMDRTLTHDPEWWRYAHRLAWETLRFGLPVGNAVLGLWWLGTVAGSTVAGSVAAPAAAGGDSPGGTDSVGGLLSGTPWGNLWGATLGVGALAFAFVWLAKWLLLGRVRPGTHGLWSSWCCRWDFVYVAWDKVARGPLSQFAGTLWLNQLLRSMGVRIGKRVVLNDAFAQVVDPDMLHFEDRATVDCMFQAHSFEDRVLKIDHVRIGAGATARRAAVLMYGADLDDGCEVLPHSVVMKHEHLTAHTRYCGAPTRRVR